MREVYPILAAVAGAITSRAFRPAEKLTPIQTILALFAAAAFPVFVGPMVANWWTGGTPMDQKMYGGLLFGMGAGAPVLIPLVIRKIAHVLSLSNEERT